MKNKMKKIISKITILVLLVAMLVPYTSIPKVEAATEECPTGTTPEYHTNYYFFLQAEHPKTWIDYLAADKDNDGENDNSTQTNYYTSFLYNFPSDGSKIIFEEEGFVKLKRSGKASSSFNPVTDDWNVQQFYMEFAKDSEASDFGNYKEYAFTTGNNKGTSESDSIVSYLFHGNWAYLGNTEAGYDTNSRNENIVNWDLNRDIEINDESLSIDEKYSVLANASILIDEDAASFSDVKIGAANVADGEIDFSMEHVKNAIETYNSLNSSLQQKQTSGNVKYVSSIKNPVIEVVIGREYELNDIFKSGVTNVAAKLNSSPKEYEIKYNGSPYTLDIPGEAEEDKIYINGNTEISKQKSVIIEDNDGDDIAWFLAPTLYKMSYKVCKEGGSQEGNVTLSYNGNKPEKATGEVTKVPEKVEKTKGSEFTVSDQKPELEGYKFDSWATNPECSGTKYEVGYKLGKLEKDTPLYACWGSTSGTNNGKTGVLTYTGLFAGIIALAGGSYYIMKKKNLFKQI